MKVPARSQIDNFDTRLIALTERTDRRLADLEAAVGRLNEVVATLRVMSWEGRQENGELSGRTKPE